MLSEKCQWWTQITAKNALRSPGLEIYSSTTPKKSHRSLISIIMDHFIFGRLGTMATTSISAISAKIVVATFTTSIFAAHNIHNFNFWICDFRYQWGYDNPPWAKNTAKDSPSPPRLGNMQLDIAQTKGIEIHASPKLWIIRESQLKMATTSSIFAKIVVVIVPTSISESAILNASIKRWQPRTKNTAKNAPNSPRLEIYSSPTLKKKKR